MAKSEVVTGTGAVPGSGPSDGDSGLDGTLLEARLTELDALGRMATALVRADTFDEVLEQALDTLGEALAIERAAVLLLDDAGVMRFRAWRSLSEGYRAAV